MRPRKPPNNTPLRDPITITSSTLHSYLLEPLLGSLSCVAPQQEPRPPLLSRVQHGNGMLANQPVAPRLEVYFPYTGTDSLSVSTCQLPQANTLPLGMLCFQAVLRYHERTTQGRMLSILRSRLTRPGIGLETYTGQSCMCRPRHRRISGSGGPWMWMWFSSRRLDARIDISFAVRGESWTPWHLVGGKSEPPDRRLLGRWTCRQGLFRGCQVCRDETGCCVLEGVAGISVDSISMLGLGCRYLELVDAQSGLGHALTSTNKVQLLAFIPPQAMSFASTPRTSVLIIAIFLPNRQRQCWRQATGV